MIIHDSDRLHEGITDGRAYKAEATFSQVLTHAVGLIGAGGHVPEGSARPPEAGYA